MYRVLAAGPLAEVCLFFQAAYRVYLVASTCAAACGSCEHYARDSPCIHVTSFQSRVPVGDMGLYCSVGRDEPDRPDSADRPEKNANVTKRDACCQQLSKPTKLKSAPGE